jgi:hypothetical protein
MGSGGGLNPFLPQILAMCTAEAVLALGSLQFGGGVREGGVVQDCRTWQEANHWVVAEVMAKAMC